MENLYGKIGNHPLNRVLEDDHKIKSLRKVSGGSLALLKYKIAALEKFGVVAIFRKTV